jgi:hypothetical protein
MQTTGSAIEKYGSPFDVTCLNCRRTVGVLEPSRASWFRLQPAAFHDEVECELRAGLLHCRRCGGRVFVEGLSATARAAPNERRQRVPDTYRLRRHEAGC